MKHFNLSRAIHVASVSLFGAALLSTIALAQSVKVEGLIKARNGDTMIVKTSLQRSKPTGSQVCLV